MDSLDYEKPTPEEIEERRRSQALHMALDLANHGRLAPSEYDIVNLAKAFDRFLKGDA